MQLEGRVAVITGAGRGLGEAIARRLADAGACVAVLELTLADRERVSAQVPGARAYEVDVTDLEALKTTVSRVREDFGRLDIMVNNAGITRDRTLKKHAGGRLGSRHPHQPDRRLEWLQGGLPYVLEAGPAGRIISLSSTSYLGNFGQINYAASKTGVVGLTRTLALEVARSGVTVNAIAPGFIDTAMTRAMPPAAFERAISAVPLGRAGQPSDVAGMAAFLASDDAAYVTGQVLFVCGGYTITASHA